MSNFEKIQSGELSGREDYEAMQELQQDQEWDEHWDEFDAELEDINIELEQAAHLEKFDEIFDVIHPSIQGSR